MLKATVCRRVRKRRTPAKVTVCDKSCYEGPCSRRLRKGEGWQPEAVCNESCRKATDCGTMAKANVGKDCERKKANAGKGCGKAKAAAGSANAAVCDGGCHGQPCSRRLREGRMLAKATGRRRLRRRRTLAEATMCDEGCYKQPCARRLGDAIVAESDHVLKVVKEASPVCERLNEAKAG